MKNLSLLIKKPLITEKSMENAKEGFYTFLVDLKANKREIKKIIEEQFKVNVLDIKTITLKGKIRKAGKRRMEISSSARKKAIVRLAKDQKIDAFEVGGK